MTKISELMDEVFSLPREKLLPGVPAEERGPELELLASLAPKTEYVRRGCFAKHGSIEVKVLILVPTHRPRYLILARNGDQDSVTFDGAVLHINTVEEIHQYISELCSENAH